MFDNKDFYPTKDSTIEKLIEGIELYELNTILEPSAGKGNIVDYLVNKVNKGGSYYRNPKKLDIDCIEIDENLRYILQGKNNCRIVHDNFLTFNTFKAYSLIIANFPFSEGDKHLRKALSMLEDSGGKLRCLINAETIKNPYSNLRKEIVNILNYHNAEIEYLQDEFIDAERTTSVEVALIRVDIHKKEVGSIILDDLKQAQIEKERNYECKYVADGNFINAIIKQYEFECSAGVKLIEEYNKLKSYTSSEFNKDSSILSLRVYGDNSYNSPTENNLINEYLKKVRYKYWKALFNNPEFTRLFTSNLQRDFYNKLDDLSNYDFNEFNINEIRKQLNNQIVTGAKETILSLFDEFSRKHYWDKDSKNIHYYSGWKSNSCWKINKRVIIPLNGFESWNNEFNPLNYSCIDKLLDIEKTFNYLDSGRSEEVDLREVLKKAKERHQSKGIISKFFKMDFYKKATIHLTFLDEELLKKFNIFGSLEKRWLPPNYGKKKYEDMSEKEKEIINNFEGEAEYKKVINNKIYYLYDFKNMSMLSGGMNNNDI